MPPEARARRDAFFDAVGTAPLVMGILNLTPDSFSDGGSFLAADVALAHAREMVRDGCAIVDAGAELTRPGATPVTEAAERDRLAPVIERLVASLDAPVSIDTYKATTAAFATARGAILVNDVWGLQKDPAMADAVAEAEAGIVITHNRAEKDESVDIIADMRRFFDRSLALAAKAGIPRRRIILDPGIGFAKTSRQNLAAVAGIARFSDYRLPMLVGASRKRFLGGLTGDGGEATLAGTIAVNLAAAAAGAAVFRVHEVAPNAVALKLFATIRRAALS